MRLIELFTEATVENTPAPAAPAPWVWDFSMATRPVNGAPAPMLGARALHEIGRILERLRALGRARAGAGPEFELYSFTDDPLDQHDVAAAHPELVAAMAAELQEWLDAALAPRVDTTATEGLSPLEIDRLPSLRYIQ